MQIEQDRLGRLSRKQTRQHEHKYGMRTGQVEQAEQETDQAYPHRPARGGREQEQVKNDAIARDKRMQSKTRTTCKCKSKTWWFWAEVHQLRRIKSVWKWDQIKSSLIKD